MTLVQIARGLNWPMTDWLSSPAALTIDLTGEKAAFIGRLYIDGRPTSAKTLSTGTISFCTFVTTLANGSTTLDVGIQGVASTGPVAQPNGTFSVKRRLIGGASGLTGLAWNTVTMNSGTASLAHGDLIAVVWDMVARAGSDEITILGRNPPNVPGYFPTTNVFLSSAWQTSRSQGAGNVPAVTIVFDDGTRATIDGSLPLNNSSLDNITDTTNPDEMGMIFQVPFDCKVDGFHGFTVTTDGSSDYTWKLYSDPTGTPTLMTSLAVLAEQVGAPTNDNYNYFALATEQTLTRNTDYLLTVRGTGTTNVGLRSFVFGNTADRVFLPGGTTVKKASRQNDTGAFTVETPAVTMYPIGVRISQVHDTSGGGGSFGMVGG